MLKSILFVTCMDLGELLKASISNTINQVKDFTSGIVNVVMPCTYNNRHLVWMTYLNDIEEGGGTDFLHQDYTVKPKKGKTVIWPSDWTYTHKGQVAPNEDKYIITGWFDYLDETPPVGRGMGNCFCW